MTRRIDAHVHVYAKATSEFPREVTDQFPADGEAPVEGLLAAMEASDIHQAVLVQLGGGEIAHHRYLTRCLREHAGRFRGIGLIPDGCDDVEAHMRSLADDAGIIGFRLRELGGLVDPFEPFDPAAVAAWPIWECAAKHDYVLWLYIGAAEAHLLPYMVEAFPTVRVVLNHLGICPGEGQLTVDEAGRPHIDVPSYNPAGHSSWRLSQYENVSVLLSGQYAFSKDEYPYEDKAGWARGLLDSFGDRRAMWASDYPWIAHDPGYPAVADILPRTLGDVGDPTMRRLMGGNAAEILRFPARE
jgi:predicted TIM-barrel fold metal-dependent hydrolase